MINTKVNKFEANKTILHSSKTTRGMRELISTLAKTLAQFTNI